MRIQCGLVVCLACCAVRVPADEVLLKGGGRLVGEVVEQSQDSVTIAVAVGEVRLRRTSVERIVVAPSAVGLYRDRALRLGGSDIAGWLELARWAEGNDLATQAREAYQHVLRLRPLDPTARRALAARPTATYARSPASTVSRYPGGPVIYGIPSAAPAPLPSRQEQPQRPFHWHKDHHPRPIPTPAPCPSYWRGPACGR